MCVKTTTFSLEEIQGLLQEAARTRNIAIELAQRASMIDDSSMTKVVLFSLLQASTRHALDMKRDVLCQNQQAHMSYDFVSADQH
jgi:hypothetical protein